MNQRFTLDRRSFEQFLAALSLAQQIKRQAAYQRALSDPNQPFVSLLQLQRAIHSGVVDLPVLMAGVVKLAQSVAGANAAGIWLFRNEDEFSCYAHVGNIQDPDRLGADILAQLASSNYGESNSCAFSPTLRKASHYPGSPNSVAIAPVRFNQKIVGAIATFAGDFDAFASRDLDNLQFLAGLLEQALQKAMQAGYREVVALEHAALLKQVERIGPNVSEFDRQLAPSWETRSSEPIEDSSLSRERSVYSRVQQDSSSHSLEAEISVHNGELSAADLSVPGVGVRAALGDVREFTGDEPPFFLWATLRNGSNRVRGLAAKCRSGAMKVISGTALGMRNTAVQAARTPRQLAQHIPFMSIARLHAVTLRKPNAITRINDWKLKVRIRGGNRLRPSNWLQFHSSWVDSVGLRPLLLLRSIAAKSRTFLDNGKEQITYLLRLTKVQARSLRREFRQKRANVFAAVAQERMRVRIAQRRQKSILTNSAEMTGDALQHAGQEFANVASSAGHSAIAAFSMLQGGVVKLKRPQWNPRALRRSASAIGVLAIMAIFVSLQGSVRHSLERVHAASAPAVAVTSSVPAALAEATVQPKPGPNSHLQITDASVVDTLRDLTRYEIITLQRAADYGDDEAAFQLGMAYETGYYVRQNCSKAAHWVKVAAESGNPAAAYNLGLRYRTGDGLQVDGVAAEHWLHMASARSYSPAKLALAAVR